MKESKLVEESEDGAPMNLRGAHACRGSTDVLANAFTFEREMNDAIIARCGKPTEGQPKGSTETFRQPWER